MNVWRKSLRFALLLLAGSALTALSGCVSDGDYPAGPAGYYSYGYYSDDPFYPYPYNGYWYGDHWHGYGWRDRDDDRHDFDHRGGRDRWGGERGGSPAHAGTAGRAGGGGGGGGNAVHEHFGEPRPSGNLIAHGARR